MKIQIIVISLINIFFLAGCMAPNSKLYSPKSKTEISLFKKAKKKIFPNDIKKNINKYSNTLVVWTGILKHSHWENNSTAKFIIEHHYWDWIEDYSIQKEVAFVSPRGEGIFTCTKRSTQINAELPEVESFAIVYGYPKRISKNGEIILDCKGISFTDKGWYATDIWDYGRKYLLHNDKKDFHTLRIPL